MGAHRNGMLRKCQSEESILSKITSRYRRAAGGRSGQPLALGLGDDAALFRPKQGQETILSCDWFVEGTHFLPEKHSPDAVGWKSLARAASDIAAMGGTPRCFLLGLALPNACTRRWLDLFLTGLRRASSKFRCVLAGGDTTWRNEILISVTVVGEVPAGRAVLRSGAKAGDILYVSGRLGEAELGLEILRRAPSRAGKNNPHTEKHLYPEPRLALGRWLSKTGLASAMMDLSDGLSSDLPRLCAASSVGARLEKVRIPQVRTPDLARKHGRDPLQLALDGGDDYELLFSVPRHKVNRLPKTFGGVGLTAIGEITQSRKLLTLDRDGIEGQLIPAGWDPFRKKL